MMPMQIGKMITIIMKGPLQQRQQLLQQQLQQQQRLQQQLKLIQGEFKNLKKMYH